MSKKESTTVPEGELVDVVEVNKGSLDVDDSTLDWAEAYTTNPPPQEDDPLLHVEKNMLPLNARIQAGDYSGAPTYVSKAEMNKITIISTVMSLKKFASETEGTLQQLLNTSDEGIIRKVLNMLCPSRIISSADIDLIKYTDYNNKISCQVLERYLNKIIPNPPTGNDPCSQIRNPIPAFISPRKKNY